MSVFFRFTLKILTRIYKVRNFNAAITQMIRTILLIVLSVTQTLQNKTDFKPERISRQSTIVLNGPVEKIFPLFGPLREKEWAEGWDPEIIYTSSPDVLVEEHMIFRTRAYHNPHEEFYTWVITQYRPEEHEIEYTVSTQHRIWFIRVVCVSSGTATQATVSYTFTSLTPEGSELNRAALERMFAHNLGDWEEAINVYLRTGKQLQPH
jgi:hypothetical protein